MKRILALLAFICIACSPALAERAPYRFELNLGAFVPKLTTEIRVDSTSGMLGATLDFEENFNLSDREVTPVLLFDWWFKKKHGLNVAAFDLQRSSSGQSTVTFRVGEEVFPADIPINVKFDTTIFALTYSYKFFNNEKRSFGINFGINTNKIDTALATASGPSVMESAEATAPLPTLGVNGHVMLSRKWKFYGTLGVFGLEYDKYDGFLSSLSGGFIHHTFKNVGFGIGVYSFQVKIDSTDEDFIGRIDYGYNGGIAYLNIRVR